MTLSCALRALESSRQLHASLGSESAGQRHRATFTTGTSRTLALLQPSSALPPSSRSLNAAQGPGQRRSVACSFRVRDTDRTCEILNACPVRCSELCFVIETVIRNMPVTQAANGDCG
jgi:hypothetical protein